MQYLPFAVLPRISSGEILQTAYSGTIQFLITDSRKAFASTEAVFFALGGSHRHGHQFIGDAYKAGVRQFVVDQDVPRLGYPDANFFRANDVLQTIQDVAAHHRQQFHYPVLGITGSNGKTIVKEWLYQILSPDRAVVKNPGSYNSQLGVPLSVFQMQPHHALGIFEAGISRPGEMARLAALMRPTLGLFTMLGSAHAEGFTSPKEKLQEKLRLFATAHKIIYCADQPEVQQEMTHTFPPDRLLSWGFSPQADWRLEATGPKNWTLHRPEGDVSFHLEPMGSPAWEENRWQCVVAALWLGLPASVIQQRIVHLKEVPMRLQLRQGIQHCQLIDDTYNSDWESVQISLDFLNSLPQPRKSVILSDLLEGMGDRPLSALVERLARLPLLRFIGIGPGWLNAREQLSGLPFAAVVYPDTESFLRQHPLDSFHDEAILIKGARPFHFEKIASSLARKTHGTVMSIDLGALAHNLTFFRSRLRPGTQIMAMVKAFAYGSGSEEVAGLLQYHGADYLGVAYPDEGILLRQHQIQLPVLVMNASLESIPHLVRHRLEPEVYSLSFLRSLASAGQPMRLHLKIETGMHRLGFGHEDTGELIHLLQSAPQLEVASVFSHLAGADDPQHDDYTRAQAARFERVVKEISDALAIKPLRHLVNTAGILRFPQFHYDMVRLGIGLYGVSPLAEPISGLRPVARLRTTVSQIKQAAAGDTIGYGRKGKVSRASTIATLAIGYADGFSRAFGQGRGQVWINGHRAPVIGNVCMDMTMVDVTHLPVKEGDEAVIFGPELPIEEVAASIGTIPYEVLTNTSDRVRREFYTEGI